MSDPNANQPNPDLVDLSDPAVREQLGLGERTEGGPPDLQGPQGQPQGALRQIRQALDLQTQAKKEAETRASQLERKLAVVEANLPDFPGKAFFLNNYQGDPTPEAIRAAATEAGFQVDGTPAPTGAGVPPEELQGHRQVAQAAAGSTTEVDVPLEQALLAAKSPQEVLRIIEQAPREAGLALNPRNTIV